MTVIDRIRPISENHHRGVETKKFKANSPVNVPRELLRGFLNNPLDDDKRYLLFQYLDGESKQ